jgi:Tfp pilus assembly protein PilF
MSTRTDQPTPIANDIKVWKQALALTREGSAEAEADHTGGEAKLREAVELAPELLVARLELARHLEHKQNFAGAEAELRRVLASDPERTTARAQLASVFLSGGQPENALAAARWVLEADPHSRDGHEISASALTTLKRPKDAIVHLRRLASMNRKDLTVQNNLGAALIEINDYRNALSTFREVLNADPGNSVAFYNLAVCHARQDNPLETVEVLTQASRKFGAAFVLAWATSEDFASIKEEPVFRRFLELGAAPPAAPATNESAEVTPPATEPAAPTPP